MWIRTKTIKEILAVNSVKSNPSKVQVKIKKFRMKTLLIPKTRSTLISSPQVQNQSLVLLRKDLERQWSKLALIRMKMIMMTDSK